MPPFTNQGKCSADLVVYGANIITQNPNMPRAQAMAVVGESIFFVGTDDDVRDLESPATERVEAMGLTIVPGFNDAHNHMMKFGLTLEYVNLSGTGTVSEIKEKIRKRWLDDTDRGIASPIIGRGYAHSLLAERRHPNRDDLNEAVDDRPVVIIHNTGHFAVANDRALAHCGITADTTNPPGGIIRRYPAENRLTGLLEETAVQLLSSLIRPTSLEQVENAIERAARHYASEGVTSSQEAGVGREHPLEVQAYHNVLERGKLPVRKHLMVRLECLKRTEHGLHLPLGVRTGFGDHHLSIGPVKFLVDGSLAGRTAAVEEPYVDEPDNRGYFTMEPDDIVETIQLVHRSGWRVAVHALGERAIDAVLQGIEQAQQVYPRPDPRHRIEHCAMITTDFLQRIKRLGVIPVPQQRFITELGDAFYASLGPERVRRCYAIRSFLDHDIPVPGSSDRPVVEGSPILGIHDAVNQRTASGKPYAPSEAVSVEQALLMWTVNSAFASGEEHIKGRIVRGQLADFVILSDDPTAVEPAAIGDIQVLATYLGGKRVYER